MRDWMRCLEDGLEVFDMGKGKKGAAKNEHQGTGRIARQGGGRGRTFHGQMAPTKREASVNRRLERAENEANKRTREGALARGQKKVKRRQGREGEENEIGKCGESPCTIAQEDTKMEEAERLTKFVTDDTASSPTPACVAMIIFIYSIYLSLHPSPPFLLFSFPVILFRFVSFFILLLL